MSQREMARLQGGSERDLEEGKERNTLQKTKITIYICKSREREFCKVWFTYQGKIRGKNPNISKPWLQAPGA